jgi:electron-transferring-flavoprotein dehydrogenase
MTRVFRAVSGRETPTAVWCLENNHDFEYLIRPPYKHRKTGEMVVPPFDKITNVHYSGTAHDEDQPSHLIVQTEVCSSRCGPEYGHPCTRFCPANVYEIIRETGQPPRLQINASNCVHCKTCDIMDPYQVITWVPPEGGDGPQYNGM